MYNKSIYLLLFLISSNSIHSMNNPRFAKGDVVRVVRGPQKYRDKLMIINGTTREIWGFEDVDGAPEALNYNPTGRYLCTDHPDGGTVYYARYAESCRKDCMHESWLEIENKYNDDDIAVSWAGEVVDGRWVERVTATRGDLKRRIQINKEQKKPDSYNCMSLLLRCLGRK